MASKPMLNGSMSAIGSNIADVANRLNQKLAAAADNNMLMVNTPNGAVESVSSRMPAKKAQPIILENGLSILHAITATSKKLGCTVCQLMVGASETCATVSAITMIPMI